VKKTAGIVILTMIFAALVFPEPADAAIRFGIKGGVNGANIIGEDATLEGNWKNKIAFCGGVFLSLGIGKIVAIQPEVLYTMKGAQIEVTEGEITYTGKLQYNYIEIPLLLKLRLPLGIVTPFVFAGPSVGFKLGDAIISYSDGAGTVEEPIEGFENLDYGAVFGGGLELGRHIWLDVRYSSGLQKLITDVEGGTLDIRNGVLTGTVGIAF